MVETTCSDTTSAPLFERRSPITGAVVTRAVAANIAAARAAADAAAAAFPAWSVMTPNDRRAKFQCAIDLLYKRADVFMQAMLDETAIAASWAKHNVMGAVGMLREVAALATQITGEVIPSDIPGRIALAVRRPAGVVLGMAPWNAPLLLGIRAIATPLVCGNTVVLKASELCPGTHWMIGELFRDSGFPDGVVNVVTHEAQMAPGIVEALITHPAVRRVNFTGSTRVGRIVGELAGRHLKPAVLELGGKSSLIVLADADLEQAVSAAAFGAFGNQGQICMSTERIVVDEAVADDFVCHLTTKVATLRTPDTSDSRGPLVPLISCEAAKRIEGLVHDAVDKGAVLHTPLHVEGAFLTPIVLDRVKPGMRMYEEESFGPVAAIVRVRDTDQAVTVANDTEYGLVAAVFGRDLSRTLTVAQRLAAGVCHINGATVSGEPQLPFGGIKASGFGRFGGKAAIAEFTDLQLVTVQTSAQSYPA